MKYPTIKRINTTTWIFVAATLSSHGDTTLFQSAPKASTFAAVFQQNSASMPQIGESPAKAQGTTISIGSFPGVGTPTPALIETAASVGTLDQLGLAVYSPSAKVGVEKNNPLALGTASAAPNVFALAKGETLVYSVDFHNNFHGSDVIVLFNPRASDAGTADTTALTKGGYLGLALTLESSAAEASLSLQGLTSFAGNQLDTTLETIPVTPNGSNAWRLTIKLTNDGGGTDTVSATVDSLELKDSVETPTQSTVLAPQKITLGKDAGNYDLDNDTVGLELGVSKIVNLNNSFYMTNISLSKSAAAK